MKLCKIDEQGYFVEDVIVDKRPTITETKIDEEGNEYEIEVNNPLYIATPAQGGLYKPKWDGEKWVEGLSQTEIDAMKPSQEELYTQKVKELIKEKYDVDDEIGLTNDCNLAIMAGEPIPQAYTDYRNFVEQCKDTAHLEVYGVERQ